MINTLASTQVSPLPLDHSCQHFMLLLVAVRRCAFRLVLSAHLGYSSWVGYGSSPTCRLFRGETALSAYDP